jgi:hypothetical protein
MVAASLSTPLAIPATARAATGGASCLLTSTVYLSPGESLTPLKGKFTSIHPKTRKSTAVLSNCVGSIGGRALDPSNTGTAMYSGIYGTAGDIATAQKGDTCAGGSGYGTFVYSFPVTGGFLRYRNGFNFTRPGSLVIAQALPNAQVFAATLLFTPTKGDCVTTPVTEATVSGELSLITAR